MCYLFLFRKVWEHCQDPAITRRCLLLRSRKYGSRVTKPYLLAPHVTDLVLQLCQQRQFLTLVTNPSQVLDEQLPCRALVTAPHLPRRVGHPHYWHFSTCTSALHTARVPHCFPPIIPPLSSLVSCEDSLQVCKFYSLLRAFGLKMAFPFNWVCRSGLSQSRGFSSISSSFE